MGLLLLALALRTRRHHRKRALIMTSTLFDKAAYDAGVRDAIRAQIARDGGQRSCNGLSTQPAWRSVNGVI
jgi:hypothetical protein